MSHLLEIVCVFPMTAYIRVREFFIRKITWKKCLLQQLNVYNIKGLWGSLVISLNYWRSCTRSRIYYWTIVYLFGIVRSSHLLSVSPFVSYSKALQSIRKGKKRNRKSLVNTENRKKFTFENKLVVTQEWTNFIGSILIIDEFLNLIFLFDISASSDTREYILILYTL
jgi:hypothetical protein